MLTLQDITVTVAKGTHLERQVLKDLFLQVSTGEFLVIIGGNGAGKSTLLNVISGFLSPDRGQVVLDGIPITHQSQHQRSGAIAKVMQDPRIGTIGDMSILENMVFAERRGQTRGLQLFDQLKRRERVREKLSWLGMGLENRLDTPVDMLSGGQRQALSLLMAMASPAKMLLLDEITASLDPKAAGIVMQLATRLIEEEQRTTIMITHQMSQAIEYGDRTLFLSGGRFVKEFAGETRQQLTPAELIEEFGEI